jgi:hypothetical protein
LGKSIVSNFSWVVSGNAIQKKRISNSLYPVFHNSNIPGILIKLSPYGKKLERIKP